SSQVAMTSTIASPIATMSREELTRGWLAAVAPFRKAVRHPLHDGPAALSSSFALRLVDLLRRHGVHRRRARQQAGGIGTAGGRSGDLRLPFACRDVQLGCRASRAADRESAGAVRLRAAADLARAEPCRARAAGLAPDGSGTTVGLRDGDERDPTNLAGRDHGLWDFDLPKRYDLQPAEGARRGRVAVAPGGDCERAHARCRPP